jgi:hypothetical protein
MAEHKFKIGETVYFHSRSERKVRSGPCQIIRRLPTQDGKFQHVIRSEYENHKRVAKESELSRPRNGDLGAGLFLRDMDFAVAQIGAPHTSHVTDTLRGVEQ